MQTVLRPAPPPPATPIKTYTELMLERQARRVNAPRRAMLTLLRCVLHPKLWLTLWGGLFVAAYPLSWLSMGAPSLEATFRATAESEWVGATEKELAVATAYEGFWAGSLTAHAATALGFAWLFDGRTRAKLAVLFGATMLVLFMSGLVFATSRYDLSCPEEEAVEPDNGGGHSFAAHCGLAWAWGAMAAAFALILVSGVLHLRADADAEDATKRGGMRVREMF